MFILKVTGALDKSGVPYALVGGYAVALHGAVRGTVDIDFVIRLSRQYLAATEKAFKKIGLVSRIPITADEVFHFREQYIKHRNLIAWNFVNPGNPVEIVDVLLTHDLAKLKTVKIKLQGHTIRVLAIKDLISMKKQSKRPQDLEDIRALEAIQNQ